MYESETEVFAAAQTSYVIYASDNNQNFKISRLDANYYNITTQVNSLTGRSICLKVGSPQLISRGGVTFEAPGIIKKNSVRGFTLRNISSTGTYDRFTTCLHRILPASNHAIIVLRVT